MSFLSQKPQNNPQDPVIALFFDFIAKTLTGHFVGETLTLGLWFRMQLAWCRLTEATYRSWRPQHRGVTGLLWQG